MRSDDAELLARLRAGSDQAFAELVDQYKGLVLNLAARMTGRQDAADDLAQEVFLRVWRGLASFRGDCKLSTWIYRITINLCIAESKTARSRSQFIQVDDPSSEARGIPIPVGDNPFAEEVILKERLGPLLASMPEQYRTAISLYYLKEFSYLEIAEVMNVPMGTVKSYLFRGKTWLRERLLGRQFREEDIQ
jgi:RNA polymerase sigma-70 factor (ECF subfamily)